MSASTEHPKVFISYSWSGPEHEQFVMDFATSLRGHGVDIILDKWDLKPGQDKYAFMETMVTDPAVAKVLVLCDKRYKEKADGREGGVGTETQIISHELYSKVSQTKFLPLVCEYEDGEPCLPVFMRGRIFVDVSTDERYGAGLDEILRLVYEQPFHVKPGLGSAPAFLKEGSGQPYVKEFAAAKKAIQEGRANRNGLEQLFIQALLAEINKLAVTDETPEFDDAVYQAVAKTKSLRDQLSDYLETVAAFAMEPLVNLAPFMRLMEGLGQAFGPSEPSRGYRTAWFDMPKFFALEAILIATAALIKHERWASINRLLGNTFVVKNSQHQNAGVTYLEFDSDLEALDRHRIQRLQLNRVSLSADLLKERSSLEHTSFDELMQADLLLALRSLLHVRDTEEHQYYVFWVPRTAVYSAESGRLPLYLRASSSHTREGLRIALNVDSAKDMALRIDEGRKASRDFSDLKLMRRHWGFNFAELTNLAMLAK